MAVSGAILVLAFVGHAISEIVCADGKPILDYVSSLTSMVPTILISVRFFMIA